MLTAHYRNVQAFYDDPMTKAYGVPTGDFQEDFDHKERALLAFIAERAKHGSKNHVFACKPLQKWMP
jgi:hypothetical protein